MDIIDEGVRDMRDKEEVVSIINEYSNMVMKLAYVYTKERATAEDITQEVFIKYMQEGKSFLSSEHVKAWLIRVTINECKKHIRSFWKSRTDLYGFEEMDRFKELETIGEQSNEVLMNAILKLPSRYNIEIHLYYYEDMSVKEIAAMLNKNENTIMSDIHRARKLIKKYLEDKRYA